MKLFNYTLGFLIILASVFVTGCRGNEIQRSTLVYGLSLSPSGIDPHLIASSELGIPLRSVYDTLVYRNPETGEFVPGLAKAWQVSEDGLVYTFSLRSDVVFHDGTPFNADAVRISFERIMAPENNSLKARNLLGPLTAIEIHNETSLSFVLSSPFAPFLDGLSQPYTGIASPAALRQYDTATYQFHQVGTGPYRFIEYVVNDHLILEANPDYSWGPDFLKNQGTPTIARLDFRFFTDPGSRTLAILSGEADVMGELIPIDARTLSESEQISLVSSPIPGQPIQILLNCNRIPTNDVAVRRALIYATDRLSIAKAIYQGYAQPAYSPITSTTMYYDEETENSYLYDPIQATILFDSTGWIDSDGDGWRDSEGIPLQIDLVIPPWNQIPDIAQMLKQQWETSLKIHVNIKQVASFPMLVEEANSGLYNGISLHYSGVDPGFISSFYLLNNNLNWSRGGSEALDNLLIQAQREMDVTRRSELYHEIQRIILEDGLVLPIIEPINLNGTALDIDNLLFDPSGWFPYLTELEIRDLGT